MKLGQLTEYNIRNIFLENLYTKCGGEASPRPFHKKSKLRISLNQQPERYKVCFIVFPSRGLPNILKLRC